MLRIAVVALVLSTAPAWAYKPLECKWLDGSVGWARIDSDYTHNIGVPNYRRIGLSDIWTSDDGGEQLIIKNRRELTWIQSNGGQPSHGICREAKAPRPALDRKAHR